MPQGYALGLISEERWQQFLTQQQQKEQEKKRLEKYSIAPTPALNAYLESVGSTPLTQPVRAAELLRRPQVSYAALAPFDPDRPAIHPHAVEQAEIELKYEGYLKKQEAQVREMRRLEEMPIPEDFDYAAQRGLRLEAIEKLQRIRPASIGQASRISGVSPADISVLVILLRQQ